MAVRARARGAAVTSANVLSVDAEFLGDGLEPGVVPFLAKGEGRLDHGARRDGRARHAVSPRKGWAGEDGVLSPPRASSARGGGQNADRADAHLGQEATA
jgi:hypothetical protein